MPLDCTKPSLYSEYKLVVLVRVFRGSPVVQDEKVTEKVERVTGKMERVAERMGFLRI